MSDSLHIALGLDGDSDSIFRSSASFCPSASRIALSSALELEAYLSSWFSRFRALLRLLPSAYYTPVPARHFPSRSRWLTCLYILSLDIDSARFGHSLLLGVSLVGKGLVLLIYVLVLFHIFLYPLVGHVWISCLGYRVLTLLQGPLSCSVRFSEEYATGCVIVALLCLGSKCPRFGEVVLLPFPGLRGSAFIDQVLSQEQCVV